MAVGFGAMVDFGRSQWQRRLWHWIILSDSVGGQHFVFCKIPRPCCGESVRSAGFGLVFRASCPTDNLGRFSSRVDNLGRFAFCKIPISLITTVDSCMLVLGFTDVRETLYLATGDGFACMQPAWRQRLELTVFCEIRNGGMVIWK